LDLPRTFLIAGKTVNASVNIPPIHKAVNTLWRKLIKIGAIIADIGAIRITSIFN